MSVKAIVLFFILLPKIVSSQTIIDFENSSDVLPIGQSVSFFEDKTSTLSIRDVLRDSIQHKFLQSKTETPNFGNTTSAIWCKLTIRNTTGEACVLRIAKAVMHHIEFFEPTLKGSYNVRRTGSLHPIRTRDIKDNFFLFRLLPGSTSSSVTFYLRFKSDESIELPLSIATPEVIFSTYRAEEIIFGMFIGLMVALLLYNLFIYLAVRERTYLYYILYVFVVLLLNDMMVSGLGFEYLWPNTPEINLYTYSLTAIVCAGMILFSSSFLSTRENLPKLHLGFYGFYAVSALVIILNISGQRFYSNLICQLETFLVCLYLIVVGIVSLRIGVKSARFYVVAWGIFLVSGIGYVLFINGLLPANQFTENITLIGTAAEGLLLSLALADRINVLRIEKAKAQREKLAYIQEQNENLERVVVERTREIATQNEEMVSQNEELQSQQEVIQQQHEELKKYSEGLETEVAIRAKDLVESNKELIDQNHRLEQFTFITAHNLRSPVARILGLGNLLSLPNVDEDEQKMIVQKMVKSSVELDEVIHDLGKILEIRKGTLGTFEQVSLDKTLERITGMLQDKILKSNARIELNFKEVPVVFALPQYIESILYNLISNSLKYKSSKRDPVVSIESQMQEGNVLLVVRDNGIGIDLSLYEKKLFGLYQRFHDHVEGKGLGLHLVKAQVEALGGSIEVKSEVNIGTTFSIRF